MLSALAACGALLPVLQRSAGGEAGAVGEGGDPSAASGAINALGLELLARATRPEANALLSPYSIQTALAMTYAGADGRTREEMARVLHFAGDEAPLHDSFASLRRALEDLAARTVRLTAGARGGDPITLAVANRLFGQAGYAFREPFLALTRDGYGAPLEPVDFEHDAEGARGRINGWVEERTRARIRDLVPAGGLDRDTRLVLVNAIHLKAPWTEVFPVSATRPEPFHARGGGTAEVPMMIRRDRFGLSRQEGFRAVAVPYLGRELQFLVLLPDAVDGLAGVESRLTPALLADCGKAAPADVILHLPKFRLEPPLLRLGEALQRLGMRTAFDDPRGSANFDRMAPRRPDDYLRISEVFHKTFIALDEKGTEAAAATAVAMARTTSIEVNRLPPVEVRVDRPFLFAIQHRPSGACLFLGRMIDPRPRG